MRWMHRVGLAVLLGAAACGDDGDTATNEPGAGGPSGGQAGKGGRGGQSGGSATGGKGGASSGGFPSGGQAGQGGKATGGVAGAAGSAVAGKGGGGGQAGGGVSCGDGVCTAGSESCGTCEKDCGKCGAVCGNGACEAGESCQSCSQDCGACPVPCPCPPDKDNFCFLPPGTASCAMTQKGGYCDANGDGSYSPDLPDTDWVKGYNEYLTQCKPTCGDGKCASPSEDHQKCPQDCGAVCGDGVCDGGESCGTCEKDCGKCGAVCGNGACEAGESCGSCAADCGSCCGNGQCDNGETCGSCEKDCGKCGPMCGDGVCNGSETCGSCEKDCGKCPVALGDPFFAISPDQGSFLENGQPATLRALGAGMVRFQVGDWNNPASHGFLSQSIDAARAAGLHVYLELNYATLGGNVQSWHAGFSDGGNDFNWAFAKAAGEIAAQFAGKVRAYEIWNEPNCAPRPVGWSGPPGWPADGGGNADWDGACGAYVYGDPYAGDPNKSGDGLDGAWCLCPKQLGVLTTNAYLAIKEKDPGALVVAGNVLFHGADGWVAKEYWKRVEQSGAVDWFKKNKGGGQPPWDVVGIHPYGYRPDDGKLGAQIDAVRAIMNSFGDKRALAISEYGFPTQPDPSTPSVPEGVQASLLGATFTVAKQKGLGFVMWFNYLDAPGNALTFGVRRSDGGWKPSAQAYCQASGASACPAP